MEVQKENQTQEKNFDIDVKKSINELVDIYQSKSNRYQFINSQFSDAVKQKSQHPLLEIERKKMQDVEIGKRIFRTIWRKLYSP